MRLLILLLTVLAIAACAAPSHEIHLAPSPEIEPATVGRNYVVALHVDDQRARSYLGRPRQDEGGSGIIFTEQDVAEVVGSAVAEAFGQRGFRIRTGADIEEPRTLQVRLIGLERTHEGREFRAEAILEVVATNAHGEPDRRYRSRYRARYAEERPLDTPALSERLINRALSEAVSHMALDDGLADFLISR